MIIGSGHAKFIFLQISLVSFSLSFGASYELVFSSSDSSYSTPRGFSGTPSKPAKLQSLLIHIKSILSVYEITLACPLVSIQDPLKES